jgi:hypothetical protein
MTGTGRIVTLYGVMALLIIAVGMFQSWIFALTILNLCLISAIGTVVGCSISVDTFSRRPWAFVQRVLTAQPRQSDRP